jgi:hypothetical protein
MILPLPWLAETFRRTARSNPPAPGELLRRDGSQQSVHIGRPLGPNTADSSWQQLLIRPVSVQSFPNPAGRVDKISRLSDGKRLVRLEVRLSRPPGNSINKGPQQTPNPSAQAFHVKRKTQSNRKSLTPSGGGFCSLGQILDCLNANNNTPDGTEFAVPGQVGIFRANSLNGHDIDPILKIPSCRS